MDVGQAGAAEVVAEGGDGAGYRLQVVGVVVQRVVRLVAVQLVKLGVGQVLVGVGGVGVAPGGVACALGGGVLLQGGCSVGLGELAGEEDGAADGARDAVEGDGGVSRWSGGCGGIVKLSGRGRTEAHDGD